MDKISLAKVDKKKAPIKKYKALPAKEKLKAPLLAVAFISQIFSTNEAPKSPTLPQTGLSDTVKSPTATVNQATGDAIKRKEIEPAANNSHAVPSAKSQDFDSKKLFESQDRDRS